MSYVPTGKVAGPAAAAALVPQSMTVAGAVALSFAPGVRETSCALTLTGNVSITVGGFAAASDQVMTVDLIQGGSGGFTPTFTNVSWAGGIAPGFNTAPGKQDTVQVRAVGADVMGWPVSMGRLPMVASLPGAPAAISVTAGAAQNSINATAVSAYPAVTGYNVYAGPSAGGESAVPIASNVSLPFVESGLPPVARFYKVAAVNAVGVGAMSAEGSGTPSVAGQVPGVPSSVTAVPGNGQITVNAGAVVAVPAVTGYTIYRGVSAGSEAATPVATNVSLPYLDAGVSNGTSYFYKVAAVNAVGTGAESSEVSAVPVAPATSPAHYTNFTGVDNVIYASPNAVVNPGASTFDVQAHVRMANYAATVYGGSGETNLFGAWDIAPANRMWRLGLTATGAVRVSWATGAASDQTAVSTASIPSAANGGDLWIRATVTPTTGAAAFYISVDGTAWTALGAPVIASGAGAVYVPASMPYICIGANASGGATGNTAEQFSGRFYEARLLINGALVTDPTAGPSGVTDSKGIVYTVTGASTV